MTSPTRRSHDFTPVAEEYDRTRAVPLEVLEAAFRLLVEQRDIVLGEPVLEPGCGTGVFTVPFFHLGASMVGLDISEAMLAIVREKAPTLLLHLGSVYDIPFEDASFGTVIVSKLFQHLSDWHAAVDEIRRVTRPGGALIVLHEHGAFRDGVRRQFVRLADAAGFRDRYLGVTDMSRVIDYAVASGGRHEARDTGRLTWTKRVNYAQALDDHERRLYAEFWPIPDDAYAVMVNEVRVWIAAQPDGLDTVETLRPYLSIDVVRWPA